MTKIAVIGAGIVGICTSFFLQRAGFKVSLIDYNEPGSQTSFGHACTFADYACIPINSPQLFKELPTMILRNDSPLSVDFFYILKNLPWAFSFLKNCEEKNVKYIISSLAKFLRHSRFYYDQIFNEIDVNKYIKNHEVLYLYENEDEYNRAKFFNDLREANGVKIKTLNKNDIRDLEPNLAKIYYNGILFKGSRYTNNPKKVSNEIFNEFLNKGGIFLKEKVSSIDQNQKKIKVGNENFFKEFDKIVISAGAWSKDIALKVGDKFPLDTERGYHVLFNNNDEQLIKRPVGWSKSGFYLVPIEDGIRSAGTVEIAGLKNKPNLKRLKMIEKQTRKLLPKIGNVKSTWLGFRPTLPDSMPVIGKSFKNENILYAFGHQHLGWTLAAVTGKAIQCLAEDQKPNFDISVFNPNRFN